MNIHEYQAKALLRSYGAPVSDGRAVLKAETERWERATAARESATGTMRRDIALFEARNSAKAAVLAATAPLAPLSSGTSGASALSGHAPLPPSLTSPSKGAKPETLEELDARLTICLELYVAMHQPIQPLAH